LFELLLYYRVVALEPVVNPNAEHLQQGLNAFIAKNPTWAALILTLAVFVLGFLVKAIVKDKLGPEDVCNGPDSCVTALVGTVLYLLDAESDHVKGLLAGFILLAAIALLMVAVLHKFLLRHFDKTSGATRRQRKLAWVMLVGVSNFVGMAMLVLLTYIKGGKLS
jgi:hypothetical protein